MEQKWTDVMVDVETTGTSPDRTAIIQISAVKFNLSTKEVCPEFFNKSLHIPPHRFWDMDTANWWNRQKAGVLKGIMEKAEPWRDVMEEFGKFSYQTPGLRMWAKPTHFDFMFLQSYFKDADLPMPFHFRVAKDMNSFIEGLHFPNPVPQIEIQSTGDAHNALNDCFWQLKTLFAHMIIAENQNENTTVQQ